MTAPPDPKPPTGRDIMADLERLGVDPIARRLVRASLAAIAEAIRAEIDRTIMPNPRADAVARLAARLVDPEYVPAGEARTRDGNR